MKGLIRVLDGRMDVENVRSSAPVNEETKDKSSADHNHQGGVVAALGEYLPFKPLTKRYKMSPSASEVSFKIKYILI